MARTSKSTKRSRRRYSAEFKAEALALAEKVGVSEAAAQLKLQPSQLYGWRAKAVAASRQNRADDAMAAENARLKRLLAEKEQEIALDRPTRRRSRAVCMSVWSLEAEA